jgi:colicin import membrane protein
MKPIAYPYQPVRERGTLKCFLLALFMHALLGILLYYGVHWQSRTPAGVEAELWDSVPNIAQPQPVVQPKPEPVVKPEPEENADIALQAMKRRQAASAAAAAAAEETRQAEQRERQAALKQQRQRELARLQAMANSAPTTGGVGSKAGTGAGAGGGASPGYADKVRRRVKPNIIFTEEVAGNPAAVVAVHLAPDGSLLSARLIKSSGDAGWDNAVLRAVQRSDPLPRDENGVAPANVNITFMPRE